MAKRKEKKSKDEIEASVTRFTEVTRALTSIIMMVIKGAVIIGSLYILLLIVTNLSGKETTANIALSIIADLKANQWFGYLVGGGGLIYGIRERKLRQKNIKRMTNRVDQLERKFDPNKATSFLTLLGEPRLEDAQ